MNIVVIGNGGREHALCWRLKQSASCTNLFCIPGNAGIAQDVECHAIDVTDHDAVIAFCKSENIDLVVVGPEAPLVDGLADSCRAAGFDSFGPSAEAAQMEGSKAFMKDLLAEADVPTAAYDTFTNLDDATKFIENMETPIVVKTSGLAAGKGVIICESKEEAIATASDMLSGTSFGDAGSTIVIEAFLQGEEASIFALCDGEDYKIFGYAQDHKRIGEGDTGLNTGGMGTYSPAPVVSNDVVEFMKTAVFEPTLATMKKRGTPFQGVLFAGVMIDETKSVTQGVKLLEYNIRFGDPECQVLMARFEGDLAKVLKACAQGKLSDMPDSEMTWSSDAAVCVVMAANGYPGSYKKGTVIKNLQVAGDDDTVIFHAGTSANPEDAQSFLATGGRVLGVTAKGETLKIACNRAYASIDKIDWPEGYFRRDIAWRAL